jgi:ABC-type sugar transport system substrate-binding protein
LIEEHVPSTPKLGRRQFLAATIGVLAAVSSRAQMGERRFRIAFANLNEDPSVHLEGLGFTGLEVRRSFELASRTLPVEVIFYDNRGDAEKALVNADDAIDQRVDLFIEYNSDPETNAEIGRRMRAAGIPVLAISTSVPDAPLYSADNVAAGRIAGKTLAEFARDNWSDQTVIAVVAGDLGETAPYLADRLLGITEALRQDLPEISLTQLDTSGNPVRLEGLLGKFLASQTRRKVLIAALDDPTALAAKAAVERAMRVSDCVIVSQGLDRSIHGGAAEKKEIDPTNRGSIILGSVAYFLDRYGYEVLPLALSMLRGESVPPRTTTKHVLISAKNIFKEYPPTDMN